VPFYQALSALTGAGKTPILADAVAQIRAQLPVEPIVLLISKTKQ
jgi:type III restriction enzyme